MNLPSSDKPPWSFSKTFLNCMNGCRSKLYVEAVQDATAEMISSKEYDVEWQRAASSLLVPIDDGRNISASIRDKFKFSVYDSSPCRFCFFRWLMKRLEFPEMKFSLYFMVYE